MEELWQVTCSDNDEKEWPKEIRLSEQDMHILLQMLLCRMLVPHKIVTSVKENAICLRFTPKRTATYGCPAGTCCITPQKRCPDLELANSV